MLGETNYTPATIAADAVRHLLKQGRPAMENGHCRYRTQDGLKCAIGGLIPDAKYEPAFDSLDAVKFYAMPLETLLERVFGIHDQDVLTAASHIQVVHDFWARQEKRYMKMGVNDLDRDAAGWREEVGAEDLQKFFNLIGLDDRT